MSIKTSKRIALGVIASLVFAPFAAIAPASAASSAPTATPLVQTASVGSSVTVTVGSTIAANDTAVGTLTLAVPGGSGVTRADRDGSNSNTTTAVLASTAAGFTFNTGTGAAAITGGGAITSFSGTVTITPDVPGEYSVTFATDGPASVVAKIYAYAQAPNGATVIGLLGDGGLPANNSIVTGVAGPANTVKVRVFPSTSTGIRTLVVVDGASSTILSSSGGTVVPAGVAPVGTKSATVAAVAAANADTPSEFTITTPEIGTATVKIYRETANGSGIFSATAAGTVTINVVEKASAGSISVANSSVFASTTLNAPATANTDVAMTSVVGTGTTAVRVKFSVTPKDVLNNAMPNSVSPATPISVSVSGPGLLGTSDTNVGTARVLALPKTAATDDFYLSSDGTAGTSTITVSWGTTVLATKTVIFTGAAKTLTAGLLKPHITAAATTDAFWVLAVDANSNTVAVTPVGTSSDTTVLANNITGCGDATAAHIADGAPKGSSVCAVTGVGVGKATLTINRASTTTNSPTLDFVVTKSVINTLVLKTNKDVYLPGEKITLSLEAKDADGVLIGAKNYDALSVATSVNQALTGTAIAAGAIAFNAGVAETTYYAPLVTGTVTFEATTSSSTDLLSTLRLTKLSKTITIAVPVPPVVVPEPVYEKPTLSIVQSGGRIFLSGTAENGEGDIIIYVKRVGTTAWKERARTFEVAAPGDFNGSIKAPRGNVVIRVKQEGTGLFSNQVIIVK